jgi:hypothetical protein
VRFLKQSDYAGATPGTNRPRGDLQNPLYASGDKIMKHKDPTDRIIIAQAITEKKAACQQRQEIPRLQTVRAGLRFL